MAFDKSFIDTLNIDALEIVKKQLFDNAEDYDEIEDSFRYICFKIFQKDPHNYNGDFEREFKMDYIAEDGEYYFD